MADLKSQEDIAKELGDSFYLLPLLENCTYLLSIAGVELQGCFSLNKTRLFVLITFLYLIYSNSNHVFNVSCITCTPTVSEYKNLIHLYLCCIKSRGYSIWYPLHSSLDKDNLGGIYCAGKVTLEPNNSVPKQSDIAKQLGIIVQQQR